MRSGYFSPETLAPLIAALDETAKNSDASTNLEQAWSAYHDSLESGVDEVTEIIAVAFKENLRAVSLSNLDATVRLFKNLGKTALAIELLTYFIENRQMPDADFDLSRYSFRHHVTDPDVIGALRVRSTSRSADIDPGDVLERIATSGSWGAADIEALSKLTPKDLHALFKRRRGWPMRQAIRGALDIGAFAVEDPRYSQISKAAKFALQTIASESIINRMRMAEYGIEPFRFDTAEAGESPLQSSANTAGQEEEP